MTTNPPKRKQLLIYAPVGAGGMIPIHQSMKTIHQTIFAPSLERAIKKKKVQSDSPDSRDSDENLATMSSTQQVVYRKGQPTAKPILIYEDSRREVAQQCIANLMSTFYLYPHSEVIASSFTDRFEDLLRWLYKTDKANSDTCKHWRSWSREKFVKHLRACQMRLTRAIMR